MNKMEGKTMDLVAENVAMLKQLFPEAVAEGKIDFETLKKLLGSAVEERQEFYKFMWNGKEAARQYARTRSMGTLRPCKEESAGKDGSPNQFDSDNLYIEGDNLEVLKLLQGGYHKRIKMIYIDPPYNTGKDFVYTDNFRDSIANYKLVTGQTDAEGKATRANPETSGRYHTDWLNMMYPRLILARNLLTDDGVIFISIDDNEVANLRKLCDEVFGEDNFVASVVWERAYSPVNLKKHFSESHDYIVCYTKNKESCKCNGLTRSDEANDRYANPDNDPRGVWKSSDLSVGPIIESKVYEIITPSGRKVYPPNGYCWRLDKATFENYVADNRIWFGESGNNVPSIKRFLSEVKQTITPMTIWKYQDVGHSQDAAQKLKKIFDEKAFFDYPKPVDLIKRTLELYSDDNSIILDFFSGSGTTAHAVMALNAEDGGNRKFICVQLPETTEDKSEAFKAGYSNICEIGKERIRRAGKKIKENHELTPINTNQKTPKEETLFSTDVEKSSNSCEFVYISGSPALDIGFKVFKLDTSNVIPWNPNIDDIDLLLRNSAENILADRSQYDLLYEILLKCNLPLTLPIAEHPFGNNTIYIIGAGALAICLDSTIPASVAEEIVRLKTQYAPIVPMQVVFRDTGFDDVNKTNALQILKQNGFDEKSIQTI